MPHASDYTAVGVLIVVVLGLATAIMLATHLIGPKRRGAIKDMAYESGMDPFGDTRRRFNVRFYIVAMLFLLFDVEIIFFYPWAVLFGRFHAPAGSPEHAWAHGNGGLPGIIQYGYGTGFFLVMMLIFIAVLLVGYVYAWRKGVFRWD